ncbi:hypothetical protein FGG08_004297 [Glutinoglossum americanum]|uniref:Uncharacterized protein n=1 Tax=Glutinoglossum americanum TaxID=1670608 RepID=A0A9P8I0V2_9PEZI|nr:hypothetical protein FGG08_004297 [Glutinoglossum americanum]
MAVGLQFQPLELRAEWMEASIAAVIVVEKEMLICHQQPHLVPPPTVTPWAEHPANNPSYQPPLSQWRARSRSLASRASSRGSFRVGRRPRTEPRPSISAPSDFRRVESFRRPGATFRPLELSIYLPENRLSPLPLFSTNDLNTELEYPAPVAFSQRRDSLLSNSQYSVSRGNFRIARKPVALSPDGGRRSSDTRSTPSTTDSEWLAQPLCPRPNLPESASSQDLIAALEEKLPKSPPPTRPRSNTEPSPILHNRDSEQYRRVYAALEERMDLERRLREIDTILEEKLTDADDIPLEATDEKARYLLSLKVEEETHPLRQLPVRPSTAPNPNATSLADRPLPPTPLNFAQPQPSQHPPPPPPPPKVDTTNTVFRKPSLQAVIPDLSRKQSRSRVSNWLFSSPVTSPVSPSQQQQQQQQQQQPFYQCAAVTRRSSTISTLSASSASSTISSLSTLEEQEAHSPTTITAQSSPSKTSISLVRQRTFGRAEARKQGEPEYFAPEHQEVNPLPKSPGVGVAF